MNDRILLTLLVLTPILLFSVFYVLIPRVRMARRARALLAQFPDAERTSVYIQFQSVSWKHKNEVLDAKIAEMKVAGWTFLRATEAPFETPITWAGGETLHFVRTKVP
jgi:hypothetical protein